MKRYLVRYWMDGKSHDKVTDDFKKATELLKTAKQLTDNAGLYEAHYALLMPEEIDYKMSKLQRMKEAKNGKDI